MGQIGNMIADASSVGLRNAKKIFDGIPTDRFARMASPGGTLVTSNHPAFIVGHLSLYPVKVLQLLGKDSSSASAPNSYEALFSRDQKCVDDVDGQLYPTKVDLLSVFQSTHDAALAALRNCDDEQLLSPCPVDSPLRTLCPTLGSLLMFYMTGHITSHLGQISTWRRMEGMPPA